MDHVRIQNEADWKHVERPIINCDLCILVSNPGIFDCVISFLRLKKYRFIHKSSKALTMFNIASALELIRSKSLWRWPKQKGIKTRFSMVFPGIPWQSQTVSVSQSAGGKQKWKIFLLGFFTYVLTLNQNIQGRIYTISLEQNYATNLDIVCPYQL